jgi:hypothetical protein
VQVRSVAVFNPTINNPWIKVRNLLPDERRINSPGRCLRTLRTVAVAPQDAGRCERSDGGLLARYNFTAAALAKSGTNHRTDRISVYAVPFLDPAGYGIIPVLSIVPRVAFGLSGDPPVVGDWDGIKQVNRNELSWTAHFAMEDWPVDDRSFSVDGKILAATLLRAFQWTEWAKGLMRAPKGLQKRG